MKLTIIISLLVLPFLLLAGCAVAPDNQPDKDVLTAQVQEAVTIFKTKDPTIERFFKQSYGYAVFPKIFKAGLVASGAYGRGEVFEGGKMAGYSSMSQASVGFSIGGEFYREIVFFRDKYDLDKFKRQEYTFAAQVTGVAVTAGAASKWDYKAGLAVFIMAESGLMVDASVGGQRFEYLPLPIEYKP